jgi:hypothetical protein
VDLGVALEPELERFEFEGGLLRLEVEEEGKLEMLEVGVRLEVEVEGC